MQKMILTGLFLVRSVMGISQTQNWQHLDLQKDGVFGISLDKAYRELLAGKKPARVIVAIVDNGIDTAHEDLRSILWSDTDGSHGWNYIGPETGREDITNIVGADKQLYDSLQFTNVPEMYRSGYQVHRKWSKALEMKKADMLDFVADLSENKKILDGILQKIGKAQPVEADFKSFTATDDKQKLVLKMLLRRLHIYPDFDTYRRKEVDELIDRANFHLKHGLNLQNDEPDTAKGDTNIFPDAVGLFTRPDLGVYHGTHVAGIIGAIRNNGVGMNGIADNVRIMMLKDNGNIREMRNSCLARAIVFAVDHGAKVINLSFGKPYTWDRGLVDSAVRYAMRKDVLIIHAAGNAGQDLDKQDHFPTPVYMDGGKADAWIEVGASGFKDDTTLATDFSNYGHSSVDVFAPGVQIYSTLPFNQYQAWDGTSMAAPMVSGLAALIREYYPALSAVQVKEIIMKTVTKVGHHVLVNGSDGQRISLPFSALCVSGGIINAYNALLLADRTVR